MYAKLIQSLFIAATVALACATAPSAYGGSVATSRSPGPPRSQRIKALERTLRFMQRDYGKLHRSGEGPQDVFDYRVGELWRRASTAQGRRSR